MKLGLVVGKCLIIRQPNSIHSTSIWEAGWVDKLDTVNFEKGWATKVIFFITHISVFLLHNEEGHAGNG